MSNLTIKSVSTTISLANGNISRIEAVEGLTDLNQCYGITGAMTMKEAKAVSQFVKLRSGRYDLDDYKEVISHPTWVQDIANYIARRA
jgi:hypothetical protein